MKDNELRGLFLQQLYDHRAETQNMAYDLTPANFEFPITQIEIIRIGLQLEEYGLAQHLTDTCNVWRITAPGVDVVERGGFGSPIEVRITNITNSVGVMVGDHNTQDVCSSFKVILGAIDKASASASQKAEAKSLLGQFIRHPLVTSIAGGVSQVLLENILTGPK